MASGRGQQENTFLHLFSLLKHSLWEAYFLKSKVTFLSFLQRKQASSALQSFLSNEVWNLLFAACFLSSFLIFPSSQAIFRLVAFLLSCSSCCSIFCRNALLLSNKYLLWPRVCFKAKGANSKQAICQKVDHLREKIVGENTC